MPQNSPFLTGTHPLAADEDVAHEILAEAQIDAAHTLGRLSGLVAHLPADAAALFAHYLVREVLIEALVQAGFSDAPLRFPHWFAGLDRGPQDNPLTAASAAMIVAAILQTLASAAWEPLAQAARYAADAGTFDSSSTAEIAAPGPAEAVELAAVLVQNAARPAQEGVPFAALSQLYAALRQSEAFAPVSRETIALPLGGHSVAIERAGTRTPLWAIDLSLGQLLLTAEVLRPALPLPGAIRAEALLAHLWPRERGMLEAQALTTAAKRLGGIAGTAIREASAMRARLTHLRSTSRAPQLFIALAGLGPMRPAHLGVAFGITRYGAREILGTLEKAGLVTLAAVKGQVLASAEIPATRAGEAAAGDMSEARPPNAAFDAFDAEMDDIDLLLARTGKLLGDA